MCPSFLPFFPSHPLPAFLPSISVTIPPFHYFFFPNGILVSSLVRQRFTVISAFIRLDLITFTSSVFLLAGPISSSLTFCQSYSSVFLTRSQRPMVHSHTHSLSLFPHSLPPHFFLPPCSILPTLVLHSHTTTHSHTHSHTSTHTLNSSSLPRFHPLSQPQSLSLMTLCNKLGF